MATLTLAQFHAPIALAARLAAPQCTDTHRPIQSPRRLPTLRSWLDGAWGMIFSHPQDCEHVGFERDRWLMVLSQEFRTAGVRPLACRRDGARTDVGWTSAVTGDAQAVALEGAVADLAARQLRADILAFDSRFVLVVDGGLRRRAALAYRRPPRQLSPLELLASTLAVRGRGHERQAA